MLPAVFAEPSRSVKKKKKKKERIEIEKEKNRKEKARKKSLAVWIKYFFLPQVLCAKFVSINRIYSACL